VENKSHTKILNLIQDYFSKSILKVQAWLNLYAT